MPTVVAAHRGIVMSGSDEPSFQSFIEDLQTNSLTYEDAKRRYAELGDRIRNRYEREITAVSLDVVDSRGLKHRGTPMDAQLTFDAFHEWVEDELRDAGSADGQWTWAGDGLLAVFDQAEAAVRLSRQLIEDLARFNARANRLRDAPLQLRIGVHTGPIITADAGGGMSSGALGKIASDTVDLAGHLQKSALPNQVLISQTTYTKLREGGGQFARVERELPNPATCFAFPPHTALLPPPPPKEPTLQGVTLHTAPPEKPSAPGWGLAFGVGGVAVALGVIVSVLVLRPQLMGRPQNTTTTPVVLRQEPPPGSPLIPNPGNPIGPGTPTSPSNGTPPGPPPGPGAPPDPPAGPGSNPTSGYSPEMTLWRSPDADSGVPARLTESPPDLRWILSIGVGAYQDSSFSAEGAGRDAQQVAQALQAATQTPANHVQILTDQNATLAGIKQAFGWLQGNARSGRDTVYVYLAGAAAPVAGRGGGSSYALLAADATSANPSAGAVFGADIVAWLGATRAQTVVVFADTPFSGAMETPSGTDQGRQYALLAATGSGQGTNAREGQSSVFGNTLASGLRSADADHNGRTSLAELQQYLRAEVARRSGGVQSPEARPGFGGYLPDINFTP
jgi:class 3 adenylate cyclase